jgi:hypothetical protein
MNDNKLKAIELTIESLKQYITLSTLAIGGLLTYYSLNQDTSKTLLLVSVSSFGVCTLVSVYNINLFINKLDRNEIEVRASDARTINFIAILLFITGIVLSFFYFKSSDEIQMLNQNGQLIITNSEIKIGKEFKNKVSIEKDSIKGVTKILVNN